MDVAHLWSDMSRFVSAEHCVVHELSGFYLCVYRLGMLKDLVHVDIGLVGAMFVWCPWGQATASVQDMFSNYSSYTTYLSVRMFGICAAASGVMISISILSCDWMPEVVSSHSGFGYVLTDIEHDGPV